MVKHIHCMSKDVEAEVHTLRILLIASSPEPQVNAVLTKVYLGRKRIQI